jgi:hypothetical protein
MLLTLSFVLLGLTPQDPPAATPKTPKKLPVSVLYAGESGTPREALFLDFLRSRFEKVASVPSGELLKSRGEGFDVVIADGATDLIDNRLEMRGCTKLDFPADWTKPTVLIASSGRAVEKTTKIGWL